MGCPCIDTKTGEVKIVPAKTKEMIYRTQSPAIEEAIKKEKEKPTAISSYIGGNKTDKRSGGIDL